MRNIVLISHGPMAGAVKASLEMIVGEQPNVHAVSLKPDGDDIQFEHDFMVKMAELDGATVVLADLLGGTPCNVALKNFSDDESVTIIAGLSLPLALEATMNEGLSSTELAKLGKTATVDAKACLESAAVNQEAASSEVDLDKFAEYKGKANLVNVRIDERLIHGQVAGIWSTSLNTQRIIVANDEAAADDLQKSSLRMAAPSSMRLSVLAVEEAAKNIMAGKYGKQRVFLLFKQPADVLRFIEAGGKLEQLNVGNMSHKDGAREVTKSIKVMPKEEEIFKAIDAKAVKITAQLVPSEPSIDFMEKLNKI